MTVTPGEVVTDAAAVYPGVLHELIPSAWHHVEQYASNPIEADHEVVGLVKSVRLGSLRILVD